MAKIYLNRLAKKYDIDPADVSGVNYRILMQDILARNTKNITEATTKLTDTHWEKAFKKITTKERRFILPDVSEVLPKKALYIKKAADQGHLITNSLRNKLSDNLKEAMTEFRTKITDEPAYLRRRGAKAGTINPKLIALFQKKITGTFEAYTKKDPRYGIPSNIKTIAVTEARSAINDIKDAYTQELMKKNPDIRMRKKWIQNKSLSKKPRRGHTEIHGTKIDYYEKFHVPLYKKIKKRMILIGHTKMDRPHDPTAPLEQFIGCGCDIEYFAEAER